MPDRTQDLANHRKVATACKNYTDKKIDDLKWELGSHTLDVESDTTTAYAKTIPSGAIKCHINKVGGMSYKSINIWDEQWEVGSISTTNGTNIISDTQIRAKNQFRITPNTTYYFKGTSTYFNALYYDINGGFVSYSAQTINNTFTTPNNAYYMRFNLLSAYGTTYNNDICINVSNSSINGNYYPYFEGIRDSAVTSVVSKDSNNNTIDTFTIPAEVQALEGYGRAWSVLDLKNKRFSKGGYIDLGSLEWSKDTNRIASLGLADVLKNIPNSTVYNLLCVKYTADTFTNIYNHTTDNTIGVRSGNKELSIYDSYWYNNWNATDFKNSLSGVYLYYEPATLVETDISEYIEDNIIEVEPNGTLTYNNTYEQAVPSEIDYLIEEVKA